MDGHIIINDTNYVLPWTLWDRIVFTLESIVKGK
jgi:hypothetical protein